MSRIVAVIWHASFSILAGVGYFFFVLPRWWELSGDWSTTLGMIMRIVTGAVIALAALPVVFTWQRTRRPEFGTPELALRLRVCSIALHALGGALIIGTAISEIWFSLDGAGRWLFGIYGAAAAISLLGIFAFYLAFVAELPPPPPRPVKKKKEKERKSRRRRKSDEEAADEATEPEDEEDVIMSDDTDETDETDEADETADTDAPAEATPEDETAASEDETPADEDTGDAASGGGLRNRRPSGKIRRPRRFRKSDGGVAVDD